MPLDFFKKIIISNKINNQIFTKLQENIIKNERNLWKGNKIRNLFSNKRDLEIKNNC